MSDRILHDTSFLIARQAVDFLKHRLSEAEARDAFHEFYLLVQEGIGQYEAAKTLREERLRPIERKGE